MTTYGTDAEKAREPDWREAAACGEGSGVDPEIFFRPDGMWWRTWAERAAAAKAVCAGCPVRRPCLEAGVANAEVGVWGGTAEEDRAGYVMRNGRGERVHTRRIPTRLDDDAFVAEVRRVLGDAA